LTGHEKIAGGLHYNSFIFRYTWLGYISGWQNNLCIYFQVRYCTAVCTYNMVQLLSMSMCNYESYGRGSSNKQLLL